MVGVVVVVVAQPDAVRVVLVVFVLAAGVKVVLAGVVAVAVGVVVGVVVVVVQVVVGVVVVVVVGFVASGPPLAVAAPMSSRP